MSAADQGPADSPLNREQVLDELEFLAKVEHALVIECLSVCYAVHLPLTQCRARGVPAGEAGFVVEADASLVRTTA